MPETAFIVARAATDLQAYSAVLDEQGFAAGRFDHVAAAEAELAAGTPALVLLEGSLPGAAELAAALAPRWPYTAVAVVAGRDALPRTAADFRESATEFLPLPAEPLALRLVLRRRRRVLGAVASPNGEDRVDRVARERFVAVQQIVDKMAAFIAQIAAEAQGGVRYYNELPYFVSIHNARGELLAANPAYRKHFGSPLPRYSWEVYSGKRATARMCPVGRTIRSGEVATTRAVVRYQSGLPVPVIVHTAPVYDEAGHVALILEVFAGSQELERLAREIQTTQQRYQHLFEAVPFHVAVLDRRFRITAVNRRFQDDFGDRVGDSFFDVLRPAKFPPYRGPITQTLRDGQPHQGEVVMTDSRGRQYNMMAWTAPITTRAGKLIQVLVIFTDVTARRRREDDLASLGLMISTLAHNLKGSLTGLDAGLYLIEKGFYRNRHGQIEEGLDLVKLMAERLRGMVTDILYSAKERPLKLESVDVLQFAGDLAANIERRMRGAAVDFRCRFAPDLGAMTADAAVLRPALNNILENALEACIEAPSDRQGRVDFIVTGDAGAVTFEIADNGPGMAADQREQLFSLFYSSKGHQGTGLGLFITRKVVQRHGGDIGVETAPGQGARFRVSLPRQPGG